MKERKFGLLIVAASMSGVAISMLLNAFDLLPISYIWTIPAILIAIVFAYYALDSNK